MLYAKIEGSGKPLLIIHGFLGMSDNWKSLGTKYAAEGYEVHMLDMRNHGRSLHSDEFSYQIMVQDLADYCEGNGLDMVSIVGHSMGGKAAMFFAVEYPEKVDKLVIADISPKYYSPHHKDILTGLNAVDFSKTPDRTSVDEILAGYIPDMGTRQFLMKSLYWKEPGQLAFRFNTEVLAKEVESVGEALTEGGQFTKPVLFLKGSRSNYITDEDIALIQKHFPNAEIEEIANAGHWVHAENPAGFFEKTIAYLKK